MSELAKKLHLLKDGTVDDMTAYTTLDEVNGQGIRVNFDGVDAYLGYGTEGELSRLKYQKQGNGQVYNVLKTAKPPMPRITLKAYRNDDSFMQDLPFFEIPEGETFYINNENAPTIDGYDFVCCNKNNFKVTQNEEIKVYYIPNSIPDREKVSWSYWGTNLSGDQFSQDAVNTFAAETVNNMFYNNFYLTKPPKMNLSNCTSTKNMFAYSKLQEMDFDYYDTSKVQDMDSMFYQTPFVDIKGTIDLSSCTNVTNMFSGTYYVENVHLRNVRRSLDLSSLGCTYIIDNYID